jgi:hypothetical protein
LSYNSLNNIPNWDKKERHRMEMTIIATSVLSMFGLFLLVEKLPNSFYQMIIDKGIL